MSTLHPDTPEYKAEVARLYSLMCSGIQDTVFENPKSQRPTRYRTAFIAINADMIAHHDPIKDVVMLYDELLQMASVNLRQAYVPEGKSLEQLDHQARDWVASQAEQLYHGLHRWAAMLKENENYTVVLQFGYGGVLTEDGKATGLIPFALSQLTDYTGEEGVVLENERWSLVTHGVLANPEVLTQFGRDEPSE